MEDPLEPFGTLKLNFRLRWDFEDKKEYIIKFLRIRRRLSERFKTLLLLEHLAVLIMLSVSKHVPPHFTKIMKVVTQQTGAMLGSLVTQIIILA